MFGYALSNEYFYRKKERTRFCMMKCRCMMNCKTTKHNPKNEGFYDRLVSHCLKITHQNGSFLAGDEKK